MIRNNIQEQQFNTWFAPIHSLGFDEERKELTLCVPSPFVYEYIEEHFIKLLSVVLKRVYGAGVRLMYKVMTDATNNLSMELEASQPTTARVAMAAPVNQAPRPLQQIDSQLRPDYTFENFIEGKSNKLPRTVGLAIAQNPKQSTFNPLFIYGGSGTGKTHLVNAIGLRLKELHPELSLIIFDATRPMSIQQKMWNVVKGTSKNIYVSNPANGGGMHNYGMAVDISICRENGDTIPMGALVDHMSSLSHIDHEDVLVRTKRMTEEARANRQLLREVMAVGGFKPLRTEWWHFNLCTRAEAKRNYKVIR